MIILVANVTDLHMNNHLYPYLILIFSLSTVLSCNLQEPTPIAESESTDAITAADYAIVIHGGAGTILKENMTDEREKAYREMLNRALDVGEDILSEGGTSLEAVEKTIHVLENSPLFNAGKGAVFTNEGKNEMDASIMQGSDKNAGAVGGLSTIKNPITAAIAVMQESEHVLLTGAGAEAFSRLQGIETVDPKYFYTESRWNSLQRVIAEEKGVELSESDAPEDKKHGTVGCVALDKYGDIVAGTSTGGMTNKRFNRFGDVPIIGAGTFADNTTVGISCTGHGEYFIRYSVAHDVHARMAYLQEPLDVAADYVVNKTLVTAGGSGGLIAVDKYGNVSMPFNSAGMYRGYAKPNERYIGIYKGE